MTDWSIEQTTYPVAIRVPVEVTHTNEPVEKDYSVLNRYLTVNEGSEIAIIAVGSFWKLGEETAKAVEKKTGVRPTLINPRYLTGIDEKTLNGLKKNHSLVITLEDGILDGGFGEKIARFYGDSDMKVRCYGLKKEFLDRYDPEEILKKNGLTAEQITSDIK